MMNFDFQIYTLVTFNIDFRISSIPTPTFSPDQSLEE